MYLAMYHDHRQKHQFHSNYIFFYSNYILKQSSHASFNVDSDCTRKPTSQGFKCIKLNAWGDASPLLGHKCDAVTHSATDMGKQNDMKFMALSLVF